MKLTIGIPNYNGGGNLIRAIKSALNIQLSRGDFEILVIDNCSTDNSLASAMELQGEFDNLRILSNMKNQGRIGNWNRILEEARGEYVVFLFSNDQIHPANNIIELLTEMKKNNIFMSKSRKTSITNSASTSLNRNYFEVIGIESFVRRNLKYLSSLPFAPLQTFIFKTSFLQEYHLKFNTSNEITADHEFGMSIFNFIPKGDILITNSFNILFDNLNTNRLHFKLSYLDMLSSELLTLSRFPTIFSGGMNHIYIARKYLTRINCIFLLHYMSFGKIFKNYKENDRKDLYIYIGNLFALNKYLLFFINTISYFDLFSFIGFIKFIRNSGNSI